MTESCDFVLARLHIENAAVIEEADLELTEGLNVLTGETGAGKSILIDCINLVLGERISRDIVRTGAKGALVSALFENISPTVSDKLGELGFSCDEDGSLLLQRDINQEGRGAGKINGRPATTSMLRDVGRMLVNTHGQHDNQALLSRERHVEYLDSFAGIGRELAEYREAYRAYTAIRSELEKLNMDEAEKARLVDLLSYQTTEIEKAGLQPGEDEELKERRLGIVNFEKIAGAEQEAIVALDGGEESEGACALLETAAAALEHAGDYSADLSQLAERLRSAAIEVDEALSDLRSFAEDQSYDPRELDEIENRLDTIYRLEQKYGRTIEDVLAFYEKAKNDLDGIEGADERAVQLRKKLTEAEALVKRLAKGLTEKRRAAAAAMRDRILAELQFLDMPGVRFETAFEALPEPGPGGGERVEFLISANPGSPPKPLAKIASGGELSRIMLAIKNVLSTHDDIETSIFDEIDTGVSGRAAQKIALKLHEVADGRQVICVTHLAQIAAQADQHVLIEKQIRDNNTYTTLRVLDFEGRKQEIARIIGGADITELTLRNAEEMLRRVTKK